MFRNRTSAGLSSWTRPSASFDRSLTGNIEKSDVSKCPTHVALFVAGTTRRPGWILTHSHTSHLHGTYTHRTLASTPAGVGIRRGIFLFASIRALTVALTVASTTSAGRRHLHLSRSFAAICGAPTHARGKHRPASVRGPRRGRVDAIAWMSFFNAFVAVSAGGRRKNDGRTTRAARIGLLRRVGLEGFV